MKRFFVYCAAFVTIAALLTGCTGSGNVSDNTDGMIESSTSRPTTASTAPMSTMATSASESGMFESSSETEENGPSARGRNSSGNGIGDHAGSEGGSGGNAGGNSGGSGGGAA